ncbi:MAG: LysR family transcriptional regulator [Acidiferrobacterales bacterium]|nr:LysR family transcriptional regulator [Acidiferrobacterales bacterium]
MNLNWDDLKLFLAVARCGGLSAASRETGKSAPTLGRRMLLLEQTTGTELFYRLARGYVLTEEGNALFNKAADLETQILPLDRSTDSSTEMLVKVSAGSWMTYALSQNIKTIFKEHASTRLRFISTEHVLNISHRETVIGIRNHRPEQPTLACRKIGRVHFAGYATTKNVKPWIKVIGKTPSAQWLAEQSTSPEQLEVTSPRNALDIAHTGIARALLPTFIGDRQKGLVRVTSPIAELSHDQWLVTHQDERFRREVRFVIDQIYTLSKSLHGKKPPKSR